MTLSQTEMTAKLLAWHTQTMANDFRRVGLWAWLEAHIPPRARVLDAGCGTGYMLVKLGERGNPAVGVDFEGELVEFAGALMARNGWQTPVYRAGLGEGKLAQWGKFERVLCLDVLEHIEDDTSALAELRDVLADGGQILLSVPAMRWLYGARDRQIGHYRRYSPADVRALAGRAGLRLQALRYWNALGVLPYAFYEKILHQPINDSLRQTTTQSALKRTLTSGLGAWLRLETRLPLPFGLSLLAILTR
jgi:SAM-dependent methyltransferase